MSSGNFSMYAGDTKTLTVTVKDADGDAVAITSATIAWQALESIGEDIAISKSTASGIAITSASGGIFTVSIVAGDTSFMSGDYYHEAQITFSDSSVMTVLTGTMTVIPASI